MTSRRPSSCAVKTIGSKAEVPMPEDSVHTLTIGGEDYRLVQFHFHETGSL